MNTLDDYYAIAFEHIAQHPRGMIIMRGIPASGKTTLAHRIVRSLTAQGIMAMRIGRDDIRRMLCTGDIPGQKCVGDPAAEGDVSAMEIALIEAAFLKGTEWIIEDSTNIHKHSIDRLTRTATLGFGIMPLILELEADVEEAIARDGFRRDSCGEGVIRRIAAMKAYVDAKENDR